MLRRASVAQRGQSMIEFALALPILAILLIGSISMGRFAYQTMIVRETVLEGAKMQMIDRARDNGHGFESSQMTNDQVLGWIRAAATTDDPSIKPTQICVPNGGGGNAWQFDERAQDQLGTASQANGNSFGDNYASKSGGIFGSSKIVGTLEPWLNTGLQTMKVNFYFDSGFGNDWSYRVTINYHYTRYAMFTFPFLAKQAGEVSATCG